jgi:hypothetical protein
MLRFRQMKSLQKFASVHANLHNHFNLERRLVGVTDAESVLREYPALLREQGKLVPTQLPTGGSMAYRACA